LRTKGKAVRLGIEAPNNVPVVRGELQFESENDFAEGASSPDHLATASASVAGPKRSRDAMVESEWTTKTRPQPARRQQSLELAAVEHRRIPRGKVSQIMPQLVSGNSTLRAMLDQRSSAL
jgi:hypothetical protein